jgi:hypothetical protein
MGNFIDHVSDLLVGLFLITFGVGLLYVAYEYYVLFLR